MIIARITRVLQHRVMLFEPSGESMLEYTTGKAGPTSRRMTLNISVFKSSPSGELVLDTPSFNPKDCTLIPFVYSKVIHEDREYPMILLNEEDIKALPKKDNPAYSLSMQDTWKLFAEFEFSKFHVQSQEDEYFRNLEVFMKEYDLMSNPNLDFCATTTIEYSDVGYVSHLVRKLPLDVNLMFRTLYELPPKYLLISCTMAQGTSYKEINHRKSKGYNMKEWDVKLDPFANHIQREEFIGLADTSREMPVLVLIYADRVSYSQIYKTQWYVFDSDKNRNSISTIIKNELANIMKDINRLNEQLASIFMKTALDTDLVDGRFSYKIKATIPMLHKPEPVRELAEYLGTRLHDAMIFQSFSVKTDPKESREDCVTLNGMIPQYCVSEKQLMFFIKATDENSMIKSDVPRMVPTNHFRGRNMKIRFVANGASIEMKYTRTYDSNFIRTATGFFQRIMITENDNEEKYFDIIPRTKNIKMLKNYAPDIFNQIGDDNTLYSCYCQCNRQPYSLTERQYNRLMKSVDGDISDESIVMMSNANNGQRLYVLCLKEHPRINILFSPKNQWFPAICCSKKKTHSTPAQELYEQKYEAAKKSIAEFKSEKKTGLPKQIPLIRKSQPVGRIAPNKTYQCPNMSVMTYMNPGNHSLYTLDRHVTNGQIWSLDVLRYYLNKSVSEILQETLKMMEDNDPIMERISDSYNDMSQDSIQDQLTNALLSLNHENKVAIIANTFKLNVLVCEIANSVYDLILLKCDEQSIEPVLPELIDHLRGIKRKTTLMCYVQPGQNYTHVIFSPSYGKDIRYDMSPCIQDEPLLNAMKRSWCKKESVRPIFRMRELGYDVVMELRNAYGYMHGYIMKLPSGQIGYWPIQWTIGVCYFDKCEERLPEDSELFDYEILIRVFNDLGYSGNKVSHEDEDGMLIGIETEGIIFPVKKNVKNKVGIQPIKAHVMQPATIDYVEIGKEEYEHEAKISLLKRRWFNLFIAYMHQQKDEDLRMKLINAHLEHRKGTAQLNSIKNSDERAAIKSRMYSVDFVDYIDHNIFLFDYDHGANILRKLKKNELLNTIKRICFQDPDDIDESVLPYFKEFARVIASYLTKDIFSAILGQGTLFTDKLESEFACKKKWTMIRE